MTGQATPGLLSKYMNYMGLQTALVIINLIRNHFGPPRIKRRLGTLDCGDGVIKKPTFALLLSFRGGSHGKLDNEF